MLSYTLIGLVASTPVSVPASTDSPINQQLDFTTIYDYATASVRGNWKVVGSNLIDGAGKCASTADLKVGGDCFAFRVDGDYVVADSEHIVYSFITPPTPEPYYSYLYDVNHPGRCIVPTFNSIKIDECNENRLARNIDDLLIYSENPSYCVSQVGTKLKLTPCYNANYWTFTGDFAIRNAGYILDGSGIPERNDYTVTAIESILTADKWQQFSFIAQDVRKPYLYDYATGEDKGIWLLQDGYLYDQEGYCAITSKLDTSLGDRCTQFRVDGDYLIHDADHVVYTFAKPPTAPTSFSNLYDIYRDGYCVVPTFGKITFDACDDNKLALTAEGKLVYSKNPSYCVSTINGTGLKLLPCYNAMVWRNNQDDLTFRTTENYMLDDFATIGREPYISKSTGKPNTQQCLSLNVEDVGIRD